MLANGSAGQILTSNGTTLAPSFQSISSGSVTLAGDVAGAANANTIGVGAVTSSKIANDTIVNEDINSAAAIAYSKLNLGTSIVNADISATAAIVYSKLSLASSIVNADISSSAAIAYSKLNLGTSIVNADISASAAIAYSKLALTGAILNADLAGSIDKTKITGTAITAGDTGTVTSTMILDGTILNADINASAAIAYSKLSLGTSIVNADISTSAAIAYSKLSLATSIVNADIASNAAIVDTKLATISTAGKVSNSATTATTANTASTIVLRDAAGTVSNEALLAPFETFATRGAMTGTVNLDVITQGVLYATTNATANWTLNVRGDSGTSLNTLLTNNQAITVVLINQNGTTAYYQSAMQIDGTSVTPKWSGGSAPTSGNASANDVYTLTILKTASATYTVLASVVKWGL
jgi:hypothetical protein